MGGTVRAAALGTERRSGGSRDLDRRAHVLRRLTFGPFPNGTEASLDEHARAEDAIGALLDAAPLPFNPPAPIEGPYRIGETVVNDKRLDTAGVVYFWFQRMTSDAAGIHERMMWFWHTLFTTSSVMSTDLFLWRQLRTLHRHAMGNLRDLANALVIDPAMMQFLNADSSAVESPNENLARELMELFLMGRDHYTEDDVRAAAVGLAGWQIDWVTCIANFVGPAQMPEETFLAKRAVFDPSSIVNRILEQDATAPWIVGKLHDALVGGEADPDLIDRWARAFRSDDYAIAPLVERIVASDAFLEARWSRPRTGIEWLVPVLRILDPAAVRPMRDYLDIGRVTELGQLPFYPPNVAGWPDDGQWLSSAIGYARANYVTGLPVGPIDLGGGDPVHAALTRCGIYEPSNATVDALDRFERRLHGNEEQRTQSLVKAAILTPEFSLA